MNIEHLVHMANRIGEFFQAMPDHDEAAAGVADHIHKFWEPRMRQALLAHVEATDGNDLLPVVREALTAHRAALA